MSECLQIETATRRSGGRCGGEGAWYKSIEYSNEGARTTAYLRSAGRQADVQQLSPSAVLVSVCECECGAKAEVR